MCLEEFEKSMTADEPPLELPLLLKALWWDAKGNWPNAHECAQQRETPDHAWVHAYLHREEGDLDNAGYWYRRAGRDFFNGTLREEWNQLANILLAK